MNTQNFIAQSKWFAVMAIFGLVAGVAGLVIAQEMPASENYATEGEMPLTLILVDEAPPEPDDNQPGVKQFSYLTIAGNGFIPRDSTTTGIVYGSAGCIYISGPAYVVTKLELPQDAVMKYLRLYYNITDVTKTMTAWVTSYDLPNHDFTDHISVNSPPGSTGYGSVLSSEISISPAVDNRQRAYTVLASLPAASNVRFCGVRVAYYPPSYLIIQ